MAKDKVLHVRLSVVEEAHIKRAARESGLSLADYCRSRLLGAIIEPGPIEPASLPYAKPRAVEPAAQMPDNEESNEPAAPYDWGA